MQALAPPRRARARRGRATRGTATPTAVRSDVLADVLADVLVVVLGLVVLAAGMVGALVLTASPASAHAVVVSSSPADQARLPTAPTEVTLNFNEGITSDLGGLTVLARSGDRVDDGDSRQPNQTTLTVGLKPGLADGTYIANYKAISADGHPVNGAIVFGIGSGALDASAGTLAVTTDATADALSKAGQFLLYLGALLAAGLAFYLSFLHDGGPERARLGILVRIGTYLAVLGAAIVLLAQTALVGKLGESGLTSGLDRETITGVLRQGLGWQDATLLAGLALIHASVDVRKPIAAQSLAFYGGLVTTASFALWGHTTEGERVWLTIPTDMIHVAVGAVWFGGLVGLATVLRSRIRSFAHSDVLAAPLRTAPASVAVAGGGVLLHDAPADDRASDDDSPNDDSPDDAGVVLASTVRVVRRFSTAAALSLIVLSAAGLTLGWVEVGGLDGLTSTTYGRLLLAKLAVVAAVAFVAGYNRFFLLPWLFADPAPADPEADTTADPKAPDAPAPDADEVRAEKHAGWRSLLNTVRFEAAAIVVVLVLTALLTNTTPGKTTVAAEPAIFQQSQPFRAGTVSLTISPNTPGRNGFHVDLLDATGKPADLAIKISLELTLPDKGIGPITREMLKGGVGHFILENVSDLAVAGDWTVVLRIRVSDFDQQAVTFQDAVR